MTATAPAAPAPGSVGTPVLQCHEVTVRFAGVRALDAVSLAVAPATIHAIIGPNGAGKSTMFNVLSGVYRPASGWVSFAGHRLNELKPHQITALGVARAFQNIALFPTATVEENLMLGRHHLTHAGYVSTGLRLPSARNEDRRHRARVAEIAEFVGIGHLLRSPAGGLSYGDQKRVEIARALAVEPSLLLVEHDMGLVMGLADRITVLDFGRGIAEGTPAEVRHDPEVIRAYLGESGPDPGSDDEETPEVHQ